MTFSLVVSKTCFEGTFFFLKELFSPNLFFYPWLESKSLIELRFLETFSTSGNRATLEIWLSNKVAVFLNRLLPWTLFYSWLSWIATWCWLLSPSHPTRNDTLNPVLRIQLTSFFIVRPQLNFEDQLLDRQVRSSESSSPRWDVIQD